MVNIENGSWPRVKWNITLLQMISSTFVLQKTKNLYRWSIVTRCVLHNSVSAHSRLSCQERIIHYRKIHCMKFCANWWIWLGNSNATIRIWALLNEKIVSGCFKLLSGNNFTVLACAFFMEGILFSSNNWGGTPLEICFLCRVEKKKPIQK